MNAPHRRRLVVSGLALGVILLAGSRLMHPVQGGLFDHRIVEYYKGKIVRVRPAREHPTRRSFVRPYSEELLLRLAANHILDGYRGTDPKEGKPLTRFEVSFLVGRFMRLLESRDGPVFDGRASLDHQHAYIPQKGWGLFEVEGTLCGRLFLPLWERGWWERTVSRYDLAVIVKKVLKSLGRHYELVRMCEVYPPEDWTDFAIHGHPTFWNCQPAVEYGVMWASRGRFRGFDPVTGHDVVEVLDRLLTMVNGYRQSGGKPLPAVVPEGSGMALARPDPFPEALRTLKHDAGEEDLEVRDLVQRPTPGPVVREPNADP